MSRGAGRAEIVKAAEESIAYQIADVALAIQKESGLSLKEVRADGSPTRDSFLMRFQSDILHLPLSVPEPEELSAMGAAYMADIALGQYPPAVLSRCRRTRCELRMDAETRARRYQGWRNALRMVRGGGVVAGGKPPPSLQPRAPVDMSALRESTSPSAWSSVTPRHGGSAPVTPPRKLHGRHLGEYAWVWGKFNGGKAGRGKVCRLCGR
jgi:hypothetical protein